MKRIMILTAEKTGTGHKSAANAIEKKLNNLGYETKQIDCFTMMGRVGNILEKSYIPITTRRPLLFYIPYLFTQVLPDAMHFQIYLKSKRGLRREINEFRPDAIISVHSMFTKAISRFLRKENLDIPFYINVIDLVKPPKVWIDKKADAIFVPTIEVKEKYIQNGINERKLIVSGFPIREDIKKRIYPKKIEDNINILLVNPSVNLRKNVRYVKETSKLDNVTVKVICGRDERMYKKLIKEQKAGHISKNVQIYSFVKNMNEFLEDSHIVLAKAGPNMILESIKSASAVVITGHIKGQENHNYEYVVNNNYGFKCENPKQIYDMLNQFITSKQLDECLKNVLKDNCNNGAEVIVKYINEND